MYADGRAVARAVIGTCFTCPEVSLESGFPYLSPAQCNMIPFIGSRRDGGLFAEHIALSLKLRKTRPCSPPTPIVLADIGASFIIY